MVNHAKPPLAQGVDIASALGHHKQRVQLMSGTTVHWETVVEALDKPHAFKLAIRQYRDAGYKDDPWDSVTWRRE